MPRKYAPAAKEIKQYTHTDKDRANNPLTGLVTPETNKDNGKQKYEKDIEKLWLTGNFLQPVKITYAKIFGQSTTN